MDRLDLPPVSRPVSPAGARVDDVAPPSVVHPGQTFSAPPSRPTTTSFTRVRTQHAIEYLHGLNRHWHRHAAVVVHDAAHAEIAFLIGRTELDAGADYLEVSLTAGSNHDAALLEDLVSESLDRLAHSEELNYQWIRPAPVARDARQSRNRPRQFFSFRPTEAAVFHPLRTP